MVKRQAQNDSIPSVDQLLKRIDALERENTLLCESSVHSPDTTLSYFLSPDSGIAVFQATPDAGIIETNSEFTILTGYTGNAQSPLALSSLFIESSFAAESPLDAIPGNIATSGDIFQGMGLLQCQNGLTVSALLLLLPQSGLDTNTITGMIFDLTHSTDSRADASRERDSKYNALVEHSQIGVVILQEFRFVYANQTFARMSGYTVDEILSMSPEQIQKHIHSDDQEMVWSRLQARIAGKDEPERYEFRIITKDGTIRWLEITVNRIEYHNKPALFETLTDITERKNAEQAVVDSEKRLSQIIQGSSIPSFVINDSHKVTHWNRACESLTGIAAENVIGTNMQWKAFYTHARPVMADMIVDHRTDEEISQLYHRFSQKSPLIDGAYEAEDFFPHLGAQGKWLFFTAAPLLDTDGETIGAIETLQDITSRHLAEETLRESKQLLHFAIEQMPIPVIIASVPALEVTMMNTAAASMLGLEAAPEKPVPISQLTLHCTFTNADGTQLTAEQFPLSRTITQGEITRNVELRLNNPVKKQEFWITANASPLVDEHGDIIAGIMIFPDITDRKRQEQAIRESEERIRAIINSSQDGIVIINRKGKYIEANEAFQRMTGYTANEMLHMSFYEITPDKWHAKEEEFLRQVETIGHGSFEKEYRSKNGTLIPVVINCWKIPGTDPHGGYYGGFVRDISREQRMEAELRQTQKMEAIGTLAAGIAHDFNNALTSILLNTELLIGDLSHDNPDYMLLNDIHLSGIRAKELVEQILTFSRQSGQEHSPISLIPVMKESLKILRASIPSTIQIQQDIDTTVKTVSGNPTQMHQVIINLMSNAAHAMRDSGGILTLSLHSRHIERNDPYIADVPPGKYVEIIVSDTGHGMDKTVTERMFEPFYTTKGPGEGTGMGLAVVHGIVIAHHGFITVDSEPDKGTSFHILLPELDTAENTINLSTEYKLEGTEHILFVDDEPSINKVAKSTLERLGYTVTSFDSSEKALESFRSDPDIYDLVITDLTMPGIPGLELADMIRQIKPDMPIIVCSGYNEVFASHDPSEFGIAATVKKPFSRVSLASAIRQTIENLSK